mmetsp:Transcript_33943/g.95520  ORF Transcript_33943/g.95520 Transcript_33943/m.95520 type:complete len:434 (+) Transcript_33943:208-1509(+)
MEKIEDEDLAVGTEPLDLGDLDEVDEEEYYGRKQEEQEEQEKGGQEEEQGEFEEDVILGGGTIPLFDEILATYAPDGEGSAWRVRKLGVCFTPFVLGVWFLLSLICFGLVPLSSVYYLGELLISPPVLVDMVWGDAGGCYVAINFSLLLYFVLFAAGGLVAATRHRIRLSRASSGRLKLATAVVVILALVLVLHFVMVSCGFTLDDARQQAAEDSFDDSTYGRGVVWKVADSYSMGGKTLDVYATIPGIETTLVTTCPVLRSYIAKRNIYEGSVVTIKMDTSSSWMEPRDSRMHYPVWVMDGNVSQCSREPSVFYGGVFSSAWYAATFSLVYVALFCVAMVAVARLWFLRRWDSMHEFLLVVTNVPFLDYLIPYLFLTSMTIVSIFMLPTFLHEEFGISFSSLDYVVVIYFMAVFVTILTALSVGLVHTFSSR